MQQQNWAENSRQPETKLNTSLVARLWGWGSHTQPPAPSNADQFEDSKLDERVRESGEW